MSATVIIHLYTAKRCTAHVVPAEACLDYWAVWFDRWESAAHKVLVATINQPDRALWHWAIPGWRIGYRAGKRKRGMQTEKGPLAVPADYAGRGRARVSAAVK